MSQDNNMVVLKVRYKLEKYDNDATKEDIETGKAIPVEVIEITD